MRAIRRATEHSSLSAAVIGFGLLLAGAAAAATLTRGPYLQLLATDSVTIVWNTDVAAACSLEIRPLAGSTTVISGPIGTVCAMPVSGLSAGTQYGYTPLADSDPLTAESVFRTDEPTLPYVFLVVGDSGCNCAAQFAVRDRMLATPADFVLHTGDMVYETGAAAVFNPKFFGPYSELMRSLVFWPCLGNHDFSSAAGQPWRDAFYTPANNPAASENYYSFDFGNAHVVVLDSNSNTNPGSPQYAFLNDDLSASAARWKFVAFHHTIYSSSRHGSATKIRNHLVPLLDAHHVDIVFMGHDHDYERTKPLLGNQMVQSGSGTVYITSGGGGRALYRSGQSTFTAYSESTHHFTRIAVDGATLEVQMIRSDDTVGDQMSLVKSLSGSCGNGAVDPGEQCDLGVQNGQTGSGCTSGCRVLGACTASGATCLTAADCSAAGEGCCGNATVEVGEECDDGNRFDLDCCSRFCKVEPAGSPGECDDGTTACTRDADCGGGLCHLDCEPQACNAVGPHLLSADVKRTVVVDRNADATSERWQTRGNFDLTPGQSLNPQAEQVQLVFSEHGGVLYNATLPTGAFVQKRSPCPGVWKFVDSGADVLGAMGWKRGRLTHKKLSLGVCSPRIDFVFGSGSISPMLTPTSTRIRQSIRIGDDCATALLDCTPPSVGSKRRCVSAAW